MRNTTFSERLKERMAELDISAAELSRKLGLNEAIISQYKSGKYEPKQNRLEEFAKFLGVTESWLMGYDTAKFPEPPRGMTIGEIIAQRRKELDLTLEDIGKAVGVGKSTVKKWESGYISNMKRDKIALLANVLQISPSVLIGSDSTTDNYESTIDTIVAKHPLLFRPKMRKVPILGGVACGEPIFSPNFDDEFALINEDIDADFALVAKGDSMINAGINDGDVIYIQAQDMVDNGQIAAVIIGEEVTLKRVYYYRDKNKLVLQPENPSYEPLVYMNEELDEIRILGRAVAQLRKIR